MHRLFRLDHCAILLLCLFLSLMEMGVAVAGADPHPKAEMPMWRYYSKCLRKVDDPVIFQMSDSLNKLAVKCGHKPMQLMAINLQATYYSDHNQTDSLIAAVERIRQRSIELGRKECIKYYYSIWYNRLIRYYIIHNQISTAVYETCRMLSDAEVDGYFSVVSRCYEVLGDLYFTQTNSRMGYTNYGAAIHADRNHELLPPHLSMLYAKQAECALDLQMADSARVLIGKAESYSVKVDYVRFMLSRVKALYLLQTKDLVSAHSLIDTMENIYKREKSLFRFKAYLYSTRLQYDLASGNYHGALDEGRSILNFVNDSVGERLHYKTQLQMANILWKIGDRANAASYFRDYILDTDSMQYAQSMTTTSDLSSVFELIRLQNKTKQLQLDMQTAELHSKSRIIIVLVILLLVFVLAILYMVRITRRLRLSEATILAQNDHLLATGEELRHAKERAEEANQTKTFFIQNMSHEVRTPLNSIVGFSQVLATDFRGSHNAAAEYAQIIENSSNTLLRLIDDVLDVAALDQLSTLPLNDFCELNSRCQDCIDRMQGAVRQDTSLFFEPSAINPEVRTNANHIIHILEQLLHNALKFTDKGGVVLNYTCIPNKHLLRFTVSDTGPGIPEEKQALVFERFTKLDAFRPGTGLGLPIARDIALKMGGTLVLDTTYQSGCRFILEIPYPDSKDK